MIIANNLKVLNNKNIIVEKGDYKRKNCDLSGNRKMKKKDFTPEANNVENDNKPDDETTNDKSERKDKKIVKNETTVTNENG